MPHREFSMAWPNPVTSVTTRNHPRNRRITQSNQRCNHVTGILAKTLWRVGTFASQTRLRGYSSRKPLIENDKTRNQACNYGFFELVTLVTNEGALL
jgi:hypothetical protein